LSLPFLTPLVLAQSPLDVDIDLGADATQPPERLDAIDGGAGLSAPAVQSDDIPLPIPAVYAAGADGDVEIAPASGDPYFLAFAGGRYYPPQGECLDPALLASVSAAPQDGRTANETYAFAMFAKRITPERIQALEDLGCRVLGFHPHYTLKVALPIDAIDQVAALEFIHWLGAPRAEQKLHPRLVLELSRANANEPFPVYIDVYDSDLGPDSTFTPVGTVEENGPGGVVVPGDTRSLAQICRSNGWRQRALERQGVEVLEYVDRIRAFRCRVLPAAVEALTQLDFVQFVEPNLPAQLEDDESSPLTMVDSTRAQWDGGAAQEVVVGMVDSGVDTAHQALDHVFAVGWDHTSTAAFNDQCEHGSHVAGIFFGKPPAAFEAFSGVAPGLG